MSLIYHAALENCVLWILVFWRLVDESKMKSMIKKID